MKVRLLHPEHDIDLEPRLPWQLSDLIDDDLELKRLYAAMADGDPFLLETVKKVVPLAVTEPGVIAYRQQILADCLANTAVVQQLYALTTEDAEERRKVFLGGMFLRDPEAILRRSVRVLEYLSADLKRLRGLCDEHADRFRSAGFRQFLAMVDDQVSDEYLHRLDGQLAELRLPHGVMLSAQLGLGNKGEQHLLHRPHRTHWWDRLAENHDGCTFSLDPRDQAGSQELTELTGRAVNDVANTVTRSADHVEGFFARLRTELGFYLGCAHLHDRLTGSGVRTCYPTPVSAGRLALHCRDLRDVGLCLASSGNVTGNDVDADGRSLVMITGANEGGKSTFLRAVGVAQVMMQAGMFVAAESFGADVRDGVFTHFKREEDVTMTHGKLDEELARMSAIADSLRPGSLLLCNESFASTNEREGSQIARGALDALRDGGVKVVFVTHLYDLARSMCDRPDPDSVFLRAERRKDGVRTFRLQPGDPEPTSYGGDSFRRIFGVPAHEQTFPPR